MTMSKDAKSETIVIDCPFCEATSLVKVSADQFLLWKQYKRKIVSGTIQSLFPELSASERELLKTGMCDACFPSE